MKQIQLWGCNSTLKPEEAKIELVSFQLGKGEVGRQSFDVTLAPNASTEVWKGQVPGKATNMTADKLLTHRSTRTNFSGRCTTTYCRSSTIDRFERGNLGEI